MTSPSVLRVLNGRLAGTEIVVPEFEASAMEGVVNGTLRFERTVELVVHPPAQIGAVSGPLLTALAIWVARSEPAPMQYRVAFLVPPMLFSSATGQDFFSRFSYASRRAEVLLRLLPDLPYGEIDVALVSFRDKSLHTGRPRGRRSPCGS